MRYRVIQWWSLCCNGTGPQKHGRRLPGFVLSLAAALAVTATVVTATIEPALGQDGSNDGGGQAEDTSSTTESTEVTATTQASTTAPQDETTQPTQPSTTISQNDSSTTTPDSITSEQPEQVTTTVEANQDDGSSTTDATDSTLDPLIDEAPVDEVLDPNITVPPPSGAGANVEFAPVPILWSSLREAEEKWAEAVAAKVSIISEVRSLRLRAKELGQQQQTLEEQTRLNIADLVAASNRLQSRAVRGFVQSSTGNATSVLLGGENNGDPGLSTQVFRSREILQHQRKTKLIAALVDVDQAGLGELAEMRESLGSSAAELVQRWVTVTSSLRKAESAARELDNDIDQSRIELEAFKAGSDIYVDGVVFPIAGSYSVPLINSFGFPRMPGTSDAHSHQGIDIFAQRGTPLVAAERGVIGRLGVGRLGGLKFWIRGESGADWYYAHLDGFAPGLHNGKVVEAGELLGYVGNTGNAIGTPPHLHLEIHPGGGSAVNPYPLLKVVSDLDLKSFVDGSHPGFRYQAVVQPQAEQPTPDSSMVEATTITTSPDSTPSTTDATDADKTVSTTQGTTDPTAEPTTAPTTAPTTEPTATEPTTTEPTTPTSDSVGATSSAAGGR